MVQPVRPSLTRSVSLSSVTAAYVICHIGPIFETVTSSSGRVGSSRFSSHLISPSCRAGGQDGSHPPHVPGRGAAQCLLHGRLHDRRARTHPALAAPTPQLAGQHRSSLGALLCAALDRAQIHEFKGRPYFIEFWDLGGSKKYAESRGVFFNHLSIHGMSCRQRVRLDAQWQDFAVHSQPDWLMHPLSKHAGVQGWSSYMILRTASHTRTWVDG